jgi:phage N-6-adenine-methyltransferase
MNAELMLSVTEAADLAECEAVIERGLHTFMDVGRALLAIRDARLYRAQYGTFEDYCRERWAMQRAHAYRLMDAATVASNLSPIGDIPATESQARPLTQLPPEVQPIVWQQAVETAPNGKITAEHVKDTIRRYREASGAAMSAWRDAKQALDEFGGHPEPEPSVPHVAHNNGNNEWYTPKYYIDAARLVMGRIDLDPASTPQANEIVGADVFYTVEQDGLKQAWCGTVWMNPPYASGLIDRFIDKLCVHYRDNQVSSAIVLVNNATETAWFRQLARHASAVCFPHGRVNFWAPDGRISQPLQGQAVVYLGIYPGRFRSAFSEFGWTASLELPR